MLGHITSHHLTTDYFSITAHPDDWFLCLAYKITKLFNQNLLNISIFWSELEAALLKELDPHLHAHLVTDNMDRLTFCHRYIWASPLFCLLFVLSCLSSTPFTSMCSDTFIICVSLSVYVPFFLNCLSLWLCCCTGGCCWVSSVSLSTVMLSGCLRFSAVIIWSSFPSRWTGHATRRDWPTNTTFVRVLKPSVVNVTGSFAQMFRFDLNICFEFHHKDEEMM